MELIRPSLEYKDSFEEAINEQDSKTIQEFCRIGNEAISDIGEYIRRVLNFEKGKELPEFWVPSSTFWLIDNNKVIGQINIRHKLTEDLKKRGGHIGYFIRQSERGKGYGKKMLGLALNEARNLGLKEVLITCDDTNISSQHVIEANGGVLKDKIDINGKITCRYGFHL